MYHFVSIYQSFLFVLRQSSLHVDSQIAYDDNSSAWSGDASLHVHPINFFPFFWLRQKSSFFVVGKWPTIACSIPSLAEWRFFSERAPPLKGTLGNRDDQACVSSDSKQRTSSLKRTGRNKRNKEYLFWNACQSSCDGHLMSVMQND